MRIKKLVIHNIASIENAEVDFDKSPLSDAELFLITGTTGAGKTTLLDAICLALYNTTPRITKGKRQDFQVNSDGLTECDPRNIMRQNTGYAYSKVFFEGNDGKNYCAEWTVERGTKRKPTSNLSNAHWSITGIDNGIAVSGNKSSAYKEVEEVITRVVGLDFSQFCRTTMLAQGEFTEFLKSDEDEKAEILEKISGSDIYRKIGAEIFNQCSAARKKMEEEEKKYADISVLTEEDRKLKEDELESIGIELEKLASTSGMLQLFINWLNNEDLLSKKTEEAKKALDSATESIESDDFVQRKKTTEQWTETIDVREALKNAGTQKRNAESALKRLMEIEKDFREALSGEAYMLRWYNSKLVEEKNIRSRIDSLARNSYTYENFQTITGNINNYNESASSLKDKLEEYQETREKKLPEAEEEFKSSKEALEEAIKSLETCSNNLDEINSRLEAIDLPGLRKEKDFLKDIAGIKKGIEGYENDIRKRETLISEKGVELKALQEASEREQKELERLDQEHERRKQTIDKFAKHMRSVLYEGLGRQDNICPVCGQNVSSLRPDTVFDEEYQQIRKEFNAQKNIAEEAIQKAINLENLLKFEREAMADTKKKLDEERKKFCGKTEGRTDADSLLGSTSENLYLAIDELTVKIGEGEKIEAEQKVVSRNHTALITAKGKADTKHANDTSTLKNVKERITCLSTEIGSFKEKTEELKAIIDAALTDSLPWDNDWMKNPSEFITELETKALKYRTDIDGLADTKQKINITEPVISNIDTLKTRILTLMPSWRTEDIVPERKEDLQGFWNTLVSNVSSALEAHKTALDSYEKYESEVKTFLDRSPHYTLERLVELNSISTENHNYETAFINDMLANAKTARDQYESAISEVDIHHKNKPDGLKDEDTPETLAVSKSECDDSRDAYNIRKGVIVKEIEDDDKAIKLKGDTTRLELLKAEYEKWRRFCSIYGDKEGRTLSKIAQSYVLGTLLNAANHHLRNMAPRYRLLVNPGTLNLKLEDKYNGYSTRSTNSISGGESFLVSLALALALADFGQHLGVSMLFIDEGFGTLSGEALQNAINTLKTLHSDSGKQVGIISHREEIRESIPIQIKVNLSAGTSASTVETVG